MLAQMLQMLPTAEDRERFACLYERMKGKLMYAALRILPEREQAENAVADAFLYLAEHYHALDTGDDRRIAAYLYQSVRTYALKERQRQKKENGREDDDAWDDGPEPVDQMIGAEQMSAVKAALKALPEGYRLVLEYRFYNNWTVPRIAAVMELSEGAVYKRLRRGCDLLRRSLEEDELL